MRKRGFTLVEMAVVIVIISILILTIFPAMTALRSSSQRPLTQSNLQALMRATAAYVQANGCLPCPMPANATGTGFGRVRGDVNSATIPCSEKTSPCSVAEGLPPYASLGLPASTAHDGWGHWISMRVDPVLTADFGVAPPTLPCTDDDLQTGKVTPTCETKGMSQKGLCQKGLNKGLNNANSIIVQSPSGDITPPSQQAAVIFISYGTTGFGSFFNTVQPNSNNGFRLPIPSTVPDCTNKTGFSRCNADGNATYIDAPAAMDGPDPYDDMLAYADRNTLVSMFGNGSCQTGW